MTRQLSLALLALSLALGCGGGGGGNDASSGGNDSGAVDPVVGTWFVQVTTSDDQTQTITFAADGTYTAVHSQFDGPTSADHPSCTETSSDSGTWSDTAATITFVPAATSGARAYSNCANPSDNGPATGAGTVVLTGTTSYVVTATTLMLGVTTTFTRQ